MPQNSPASPAPKRQRWGLILVVGVVAVGLVTFGRSCARQRVKTPVALQPDATAVPGVPDVVPAAGGNVAAAAASAATSPQMRAMLFEMDATGIHLTRAGIADGRAKAPPISNAPRRLEFEVYGPDGAVSYAGAFDHPLWQSTETVDDKGALAATDQSLHQGSCLVRIPANVPASRIEFFDVDATAGATDRRSIGSFAVQ